MFTFPDRKVLAGGVAGVASWLILTGLAHYGITPPIDQTTLSAVIGWAAAYLVPPSDQDILKRMNDALVKRAQEDPTIPVTPPKS